MGHAPSKLHPHRVHTRPTGSADPNDSTRGAWRGADIIP